MVILHGRCFHLPNGHARAGNLWELDGARETFVTLRIIVLETDLEFDGLEEVAFLLVCGVVEEGLDVLAHSGCCTLSVAVPSLEELHVAHTDCDFGHGGYSLPEELLILLVRICARQC